MAKNITEPPRLPARPDDGHKGLFGRVLVIGGHDLMLGAPVLAATAALRMGAGLVQLAVPRAILAQALSITPELIGASIEGQIEEAIASARCIVIGPGLGISAQSRSVLAKALKAKAPLVVDADALNMLAKGKTWPTSFKSPGILTPHPGEMTRLNNLLGLAEVPTDPGGRIDNALVAARRFGKTIVLKGKGTVVTDGRQVYVNPTGDSSLSKAGTGDVLSGILGTLLAQAMSPFDAACAGVWLHGRAGEIAGQKLGQRCVLARDVIAALPEAIRVYPTK